MVAAAKSIRVEKVSHQEIHILGYTRPYAEQFLAAGLEWSPKLYWIYRGDTLPAVVQNIIIGQFALNPETPMDKIIDEPAGESDGETTVVNFSDVMEHWNKRTQKWDDPSYFYIGRANGRHNLPASRWANTHPMQNNSKAERLRVIEAFRQDLLKMDRTTLLQGLKKLEGKKLVCYCPPQQCHGDVLVEFIKNPPPLEVEPKPTAPIEPLKPQETRIATKEGTRLRQLADSMQKEIDEKNRPYPFASQPPTNKRVSEYQSRKSDARRLMFTQDKLLALAELWDTGKISLAMTGYKTRKAIDELLWSLHGNPNHKTELLALGNRGVGEPTPADLLEEKRLSIALKSYDDYFSTSMGWLQNKMIEAADIQRGDIILEPSAGTGHLAQAIQAEYPENELRVIEIVPDFRAILEMLGFNLVGHDFLEYGEQVDVVIANPPFGKMQDIDHVYHAWKCLKPGGRLVSIMSPSPFFNTQNKAETFRKWFKENGGHKEDLKQAFKESERSTGVNVVMITMQKPKEAVEPLPSDSLTNISIVQPAEAAIAIGTMPDFVEPVTNHTSAICAGCHKAAMHTVERNGKRYCEECLPTPGGLPKQDAEWIKTGKPAADRDETDAWVKEVNNKARRLDQMSDVNINRARSADASPEVVEAAITQIMKPDMDDFVKTASGGTLESVEQLVETVHPPLTYDDYLRIKAKYLKSDIVMLHIGAMWTTWDDDVKELQFALKYGSSNLRVQGKKHTVKAIEGVDTQKRPMASFNERNTDLLEATVCEGARTTLVFVNKDGSIRVREPKTINQLNQEVKEASARAEEAGEKVKEHLKQFYPDTATSLDLATEAAEILDEGVAKLTEFLDAKKAEMPKEASNNGFKIGEFVALEVEKSDGTEGLLKSEIVGFEFEGAVAHVKVGTSEHIVDVPTVILQRWNMLESSDENSANASQNKDSISESIDAPNVEENAKNDVIRSFHRDALVELKGGVRGRVVSSDAEFVYVRTPAQLEDSKRHDEKWEIGEVTFIEEGISVEELIANEQKIIDSVIALRDMLRKPRPESEIPFIALYLSGAENVELLFNHYVTAIRADDPAMTPASVKGAAAAVLLYQYQQEWASIDVEVKYPAIFEAFKAAAKGEILITMLLRISGLSSIVELTYNDDLMLRLVDVVSGMPF